MLFKPFKPLSLTQHPTPASEEAPQPPPPKRRKIETETIPSPSPRTRTIESRTDNSESQENAQYYSVLWRKVTNKKHKTWDGDGTLSVIGGYAILRDERGKETGRTACKIPLLPGSTLSISGKEVEIDALVSKGDVPGQDVITETYERPAVKLSRSFDTSTSTQVRPTQTPAELTRRALASQAAQKRPSQTPAELTRSALASQTVQRVPSRTLSSVTTKTLSASTASSFKTPVIGGSTSEISGTSTARHDPAAEGALVMKRPTQIPTGRQVVDVVVDPLLTKHLRDHQREGIAFLYECVMGLRSSEGEGAILADDMGLGKSLQTVALIWTLLKQSPFAGESSVIQKAIVLCPATLCNNWRKEFRKWVGKERIGVMVADDKSRISSFIRGPSYHVLIISYEKFLSIQNEFSKAKIDLVIADEGHRLKTAKNKAAAAIKSLNTERRVVLTGTLFQNEFSEWYSIVDLVNPGLLSKYSTFKKDFEIPITKGRQQDATDDEREKGLERDQELKNITSPFILRREHDVLAKYLPPKTENILLCRPTEAQISVYNAIVGTSVLGDALNNSQLSLQLISILKKVCNSPSLLIKDTHEEGESSIVSTLFEKVSAKKIKFSVTSGKMRTLDDLLTRIWADTDEKVVIMSNYTATLDLIGNLLNSCDHKFQRLDGATPATKRQDLVDQFNKTSREQQFAFLLSTKAGGMGINLIGASRLILFDIDWNPALDLQAMARICRDGQKRPCHIYRLITKGGLDEKILQRQITKQGLADSVVDNKASMNSFSRDELRDLFTLDRRETCQTHDFLACDCNEDASNSTVTIAVETYPSDCSEELEDLPAPEDVVKGPPGWMTASQMNVQQQRDDVKKSPDIKRAKKMSGLMRYAHLNTKALRERTPDVPQSVPGSPETDTDNVGEDNESEAMGTAMTDTVLRNVIMRSDSAVDYVFYK